ncbi:MAG: ATP-binding protein [Actinomycetota bacterium]|nr:ATP-binding protein [Actinomycetota bacterium]
MELKEAVDLYRDVLNRYSKGFSPEEVIGGVAEALCANNAVLFVRRGISSFLEPRLAWRLKEEYREKIKDKLFPLDWAARHPAHRVFTLDKGKLAELGLGNLGEDATDNIILFPIRSHSHLRAVLLAALPADMSMPDQQSFRVAAIGAILERMVELFSFEEKKDGREDEGSTPVELGILSNFLMSKANVARAASLSLDLLIKLFNMDGGTVHRVKGPIGAQQAVLISSRGWGGMPEIIEHLFENKLIEMLQAMRHSREKEWELCLDAGSIAEYFPGVKPYFHANQVKSFLLTPIYQDDRLVGLLTLFGKAYAAMEPRDMEILAQLSYRLGDLFSVEGDEEQPSREPRKEWSFPSLAENLARLSQGGGGTDDFLSSFLRLASVELGAFMAFAYFGVKSSNQRSYQWYADAVYGGESVFKPTAGLSRVVERIQRMAVVKPENPVMEELPAAEQARAEGLVLLLVPAREKDLFLILGFYLPRERRLTRAEIESLNPLAAMVLSLARGLKEKGQAERYRRSLEILTEIEGDLTTCENPSHILRLLARGGRELLECDRAAIVVIDEENGTFEGAVETEDGLQVCDLKLIAGREISLVLERGHALYSSDLPEEAESILPGDERGSFIAVPLTGRKGRLGALVFEKLDKPEFFGEFKRRLAHFLAGQAVSVLESHMEESKLGSAAEETRALLRTSRRLSSSLTLEEMCGGLYSEFKQTIGAELLLVSIEGKQGSKRLAWWKDVSEEVEGFDELLEEEGPLMLALSRAGKLIRNNLNTVLRGPGEDELALKGIRSYMAVVLYGEEVKGLLLVGSPGGGSFSEKEAALVEKTAGLLSSSIAVPMRYEEMLSSISRLEEMYSSQKERARTATDLVSMASHEIRHPLTLIMGFSEVLREYSDSLDARESREVVDKLSKAADRLRRSVVNMMEVSRFDSGRMSVKLEEVDILNLLQELVEELHARSLENVVDLEVESEAERIMADRDKLEIILFNLMDNAVKYSPPGSTVKVYARRLGREVLLGVKDQGQGISDDHLGFIFQPFRKGEGEEYGPIKGMGLGLYIVNKLVEAHGGRVDVRSEHGMGSTFIAHIPQPEYGEERKALRSDLLQA